MADFGVSIGDFVTLGTLAWNLYRSCKTASAEFEEVSREVISLHTAIKELEDDAGRPRSLLKEASISKKQELDQLVKNTKSVLQQLDKLVTKYQSLSTKHRKKWDTFKFGQEGLMEIRSKIVFHTSAINLFLTSLSTESLSRIERKLDEMVAEFRRGDREASTVACLDDDVPEAEEQWTALKKELVDDGFTEQDIEIHKTWIKARLLEMIDDPCTAAQEDSVDPARTATNVSIGPPPEPEDVVAARIKGVNSAQKSVVCQYNIPRTKLPEAAKITPGKRAPTIIPLDGEGWVAVSAMVEKQTIATVMDDLTALGAIDILVLQMANTVEDWQNRQEAQG